jgi:hypothetical protein
MEFHGRPRKVILDFEGENARELARISLFRLGVPWRLLLESSSDPPAEA